MSHEGGTLPEKAGGAKIHPGFLPQKKEIITAGNGKIRQSE